jgi:hypothetical protein
MQFTNGIILYVRFNDFDEYAYHIQFSYAREDRIRYDNYDENWPVRTAPHHVHPRGSMDATDSMMNGDPSLDIPRLIKELLNYLQ